MLPFSLLMSEDLQIYRYNFLREVAPHNSITFEFIFSLQRNTSRHDRQALQIQKVFNKFQINFMRFVSF